VKKSNLKMQKLIFERVFTGHEWLSNQAIFIEDGLINSLHHEAGGISDGFLVPGFIDLQVYGGGGLLFSNHQTGAAIQATFDEHIKTGTVAFQITLNCLPKKSMWAAIEACKSYIGKGLVGLHLEGPFFNPIKRGAHNEIFVQEPTQEFVQEIIDRTQGLPTYMTIAPEMFAPEVLNLLKNSHIMCSMGHSDATYEQVQQAGISRITHLFNAMSQWQSRSLGLVGASFRSDAWTSIIADGLHCDFESLRLAKQLKGEKLFLITDAVTHDESGPYVFTKTGIRFTNEAGVLSGSALTMDEAIRNCVQHVGISLEEAIRMATVYPAEVANLAHLGSIGAGKRACFVHFSDDLCVKQVWYDGEALIN
jgi:N-acetylglucosamine-6-phosphate deacetylase